MPVSPQDFELYSRMTGAPMPSDAMSRMQMAPEVYQFTRNFAKNPNILEKTGNLLKTVGKIGAYGLGMGMQQSQAAEQRLLSEKLRNETAKTDSEVATVSESPEQVVNEPLTAGERLIDRKMKAKREEAEIDQKTRDDKQAKAIELLQIKKQDLVDTPVAQQTTTADNYNQDRVENQTSTNVIDKKIEQGSQIADETQNIAEVLSESEESRPSEFVDPKEVQQQMESDMVGASATSKKVANFFKQEGLDKVLATAGALRLQQQELIDDKSPLADHPDIIGGEDDSNLPGNQNLQVNGTSTSSTVDLEDHRREMRRMDAEERIGKARIDKRVGKNLLEQRAIANEEALATGFMNLDDEGRKKESIRLGSTGGIPNKTDMAEIRKDPEFIAAQESMKPKSTAEKTDDFTAKFVEGARSDIVRGARGNKSLGITRIPATNGDAQVGFVLANKPIDQSPMFATTYGFGVAPGAESLLDNQLNRDTFSSYMQRGMKEAQQGKRRKAGEIFEFLIPQQRIVTGDARLGDITM